MNHATLHAEPADDDHVAMPATRVEVWSAEPALLDALDAAAMLELLDARERGRHAALRFAEDAGAYLLAHALRRLVLGRRLQRAPQDLAFEVDARGAEQLVGTAGPALGTSLSRSRAGVAFALAEGQAVGVDIEPVDDARADFDLLQPWLRWDTVQPAATPAAFFAHWTALEAFWKAMGIGLAEDNPVLSCEPDGRDILLRFATGEGAPAGRARLLDAGPGCALAVATRGAARPAVTQHRIAGAAAWQALASGPPACVG